MTDMQNQFGTCELIGCSDPVAEYFGVAPPENRCSNHRTMRSFGWIEGRIRPFPVIENALIIEIKSR